MELPDLLARLHWLGNASFRLDGPPTIYFDPVGTSRNELPQADIILISHSHGDNYSPTLLKRISKPDTVIVTSQVVATLLSQDGVPGQVRVLRPAERTAVGAVEIEATEAYKYQQILSPEGIREPGIHRDTAWKAHLLRRGY